MAEQNQTQERRKPNRLVTPRLINLLTNVGLTDLTEEAVKEYRFLYESHYGSLNSTMLSLLHKVGLTNLTDKQVDLYCERDRDEGRKDYSRYIKIQKGKERDN